MINKFHIDGVPVTIEMNKAGKVTKATVANQYLIEPAYNNEWHVTFIQMGDNGPFRSSNCYSSRYNWHTDLDYIINGLVEDGYFPDCPEWVKLNTYTPNYDAPILSRVWSAKYQPHDRLRNQRFNAWDKEVNSLIKNLNRREQSFFREASYAACEMLNIMEHVLFDVEGLGYRDYIHIPDGLDVLSKEEHLLCVLFLDMGNEISVSNDDFLIDPEWEDPIPKGSCYLEDLIPSN